MTDAPAGPAGLPTASGQHPEPSPDLPPELPPDLPPDLPPAARRALAEAEARRRAADASSRPAEVGGREGPEPVRYGDWERNGLAVDF